MGQIIWNVDIDTNTKLNVKPDGSVIIIHVEEAATMSELPPEYLLRVAETLNKKG